ncbi:hypothetical protein BS50DRAFT_630529 [Corynespora cassiicola Philippines]|uniref:CST complex subunit Ten1 n=1 Tax=Corynespora cassiicola Philippines TaxID=1448308 RepID=A0A2T2P4T1_CORCC|nr:hypothetical protein BS50DRAFT_630529 [Corynespora cassiicola Philippines]
MSGPVASNLVFLGDLAGCKAGTKVRFLGCVDGYVVHTATLRLRHEYPYSNPHAVANVDITNVLEQIKRDDMDVGAWVNVLGEVEHRKETGIFVQATAVWSAGIVDLEAYQKAVEARKEAG